MLGGLGLGEGMTMTKQLGVQIRHAGIGLTCNDRRGQFVAHAFDGGAVPVDV